MAMMQLTADYEDTLDSKLTTAIAALDRVGAIESTTSLPERPCLTVYILGCDESELKELSISWVSSHYLKLLMYACQHGYQYLRALFVGPNLNPQLDNKYATFDIAVDKILGILTENTESGINATFPVLTIELLAYSRYYHDVQSLVSMRWPNSVADIVLMMNAGIWGYDSWKYTLKSLRSSVITRVSDNVPTGSRSVFLVTSYTLPEAEEDYDCIQDLFSSEDEGKEADIGNNTSPQVKVRWLWECELNPCRSHTTLARNAPSSLVRQRKDNTEDASSEAAASGIYLDNHYWSCFEFIR